MIKEIFECILFIAATAFLLREMYYLGLTIKMCFKNFKNR